MNICRIFRSAPLKLCGKDTLCPNLNFFRNTWIVKRTNPIPVTRRLAKRPRSIKGRHFIYETVENLNDTEPPDLRIVLTTFVEGIGDVGDVISVVPEYGRDYLILPKQGVYATPENIEKYSLMKKTRVERPKFSSIHAATIVRSLSKVVIPVLMSSEKPWTITNSHLGIAFRKEEFFVPQDAIEMPTSPIEGPNPSFEGRDFAVTITINNTEKVPVRCRLLHIKRGMETAKLGEEYYLEKGEPILEEQRELLESMPLPEILDDPSSNVSLVEKYRIKYLE